jgi:hypothetical protein
MWIDSDTMIINPTFNLPFAKFKGKDLVIWGNETALLAGNGRSGAASHAPKCFLSSPWHHCRIMLLWLHHSMACQDAECSICAHNLPNMQRHWQGCTPALLCVARLWGLHGAWVRPATSGRTAGGGHFAARFA